MCSSSSGPGGGGRAATVGFGVLSVFLGVSCIQQEENGRSDQSLVAAVPGSR